jgi:hypothetical protein
MHPLLISACIHLEWDCTGAALACLQEHATELVLWHLAPLPSTGRRTESVDLQPLREPSFLKWAKHAPKLAVGSNKGDAIMCASCCILPSSLSFDFVACFLQDVERSSPLSVNVNT